MAGGMSKPRAPLPAWLLEANRERRAAERAAEVARWAVRPDRSVHCWVWATGPAGTAVQWPGLVLDWKREGAGWAALAVWTRDDGDFVMAWVDAEQVDPVLVKAGEVWVSADDS